MTAIYGAAAPLYLEAGWEGVLYLPPGKKWEPPKGYTGRDGKFPTADEVNAWARSNARGNLALRLPDGVVGIDVDHYDAKRGADTLAELEAKFGPLPATWASTARELPSGIRLYRVPPGTELAGQAGADIEIIQRHHRYLCAWPSTNPKAGGAGYRWLTPDGDESDRPPRPDELADLPAAWVDGLRVGRVEEHHHDGSQDHEARKPRSAAVNRAMAEHLADLLGGRHDAAVKGSMALARLDAIGQEGAGDALDEFGRTFRRLITADGSRTDADAAKEWADMLAGARAKVGATADADEGPSLQAAVLRSKLLTVEQVKAMPPPEPLIAGVLNRRKLAILWGKPGSGKSFVALDWGLSIATGAWWFGHEVTPGLVVYLAAEGADGLGVRIDAWQNDRRIHNIGADQFQLLPNAVNLLDRQWGDALVEVAGDLKPALVIADTLARSMPGGDENGSRDTGIVIDTANRVQQAAGATVLFVHHDTREGSNLRGHSSLDGAMDSSIEVKADGQNITIKSRKQKDMSDFDDLRMWRQPAGGSCVIWSRDRVGVTEVGVTDGERALLDVARECCGSDGLAPSKLQDVAEMPNSSFYRNLKNLLSKGALINVGTENRPRYTVAEDAAA